MLSTITPFGERVRGYRFGVTAAWFVAGAAVGGASLGVPGALLAAAYGAGVAGHTVITAVLAALVSLAGAAVDGELLGPLLPLHRRQVNDRWLSRYRRWVYAGGFGWQMGSGVTTYIMTSAVFTMAFLALISGSPAVSIVVCTTFGTLRGLAVLLTSRASTPDKLRRLHRWMDTIRESVRWSTIVIQSGAGLAAVMIIGAVPAAAVAVAVLAAVAVKVRPALIGRMPSQ